MLVRAADVQDVVTAASAVAREDVGGERGTDEVPEVRDVVHVRQRCGDEYFTSHGCGLYEYRTYMGIGERTRVLQHQ